MKRTLTILFLALAASVARAQNLPLADAFYVVKYANSFNGVNSSVVGNTNNIGDALYHTFYINTSASTNGASYAIAFSGDKTNWVTAGTLLTTSTGSSALMTNFVSKEMYYSVTLTGTNVSGVVLYLGGR